MGGYEPRKVIPQFTGFSTATETRTGSAVGPQRGQGATLTPYPLSPWQSTNGSR